MNAGQASGALAIATADETNAFTYVEAPEWPQEAKLKEWVIPSTPLHAAASHGHEGVVRRL